MNRSRGVALLSVMIVVAAVSATASWLLYSQNLDIQRTSRILKKEQAILLALTVESRALLALQEDRIEDGGAAVDYYARDEDDEEEEDIDDGESWSRPWSIVSGVPPLETLKDVEISSCIYDLHGLLNLNNLRAVERLKPPPEDEKRHDQSNPANPGQWHARRFRKFFEAFAAAAPDDDTDVEVATLMDSLLDWLDDDDTFRANGAEDAEYSLKQFGYHAANAPAVLPRELHWVKGFEDLTPASLSSLQSRFVALPVRIIGRSSKININTADEEVLATLPYLELDTARQLKSRLREEPVTAQNEIAGIIKPLLPPREDKQEHLLDWVDEYLTIQSRFFGLVVAVRFGDVELTVNSMLYRDNTDAPYRVYVLQRHFGENPYDDLAVFDGGRCLAASAPAAESGDDDEEDDDEEDGLDEG